MNELTLVSTDDILKELGSRHDSFIFYGVQSEFKKKGVDSTEFRWYGGFHTCLGMAREAEKKIIEDEREFEKEDDE